MQPRIKPNFDLSVISSTALVVWALSSAIGIPQASNLHSWDFDRNSDGPGVVLTSGTLSSAFNDSFRSVFIEEDEAKFSGSFSYLASPNSIASDWPPRHLLGPLPGNSPPRIEAVPLRC